MHINTATIACCIGCVQVGGWMWHRRIYQYKMKFKRKLIADQSGSSSQCRSVVREALWGIVQRISLDADAEGVQEVAVLAIDAGDAEGLPVSFGSAKTKKRRRETTKPTSVPGRAGTLPVPPYNGTLLEDHVYNFHSPKHLCHGALLRIYGVGNSANDNEEMAVAVVIGHRDTSLVGTTIRVKREDLMRIPAEERAHAHQLVQKDEQRILQLGMPANVHLKYWDQRYRLLSRFDRGVKLDAESWYSITPEAVAHHVTASCLGRARELGCKMEKVLDCFSGCGGNTIPFLQRQKEVIAVDFDPVKLDNLRHNCAVYDCVQPEQHCVCADVYALLTALLPKERVAAIQAAYLRSLEEDQEKDSENHAGTEQSVGLEDGSVAQAVDSTQSEEGKESTREHDKSNATEVLKSVCNGDGHVFPGLDGSADIAAEVLSVCAAPDLIILSPPWGGPDYLNAEEYCLYTMLTCGCGLYLAMLAGAVSPNLLYLLPVNTSVTQVEYIAGLLGVPFVIEYVQVNHTPKVMAVYMGQMVNHKGRKPQSSSGPPPAEKKVSKMSRKAQKRENAQIGVPSKGHVHFDED